VITRLLQKNIRQSLGNGKVIIIVGARQVGKTTLAESIIGDEFGDSVLRINCDRIGNIELLAESSLERLQRMAKDKKCIFIDEAQKVPRIGEILKILVDHYKKNKQIIVTGSSSVNLLDYVEEPLTGRKRVYNLHSFSMPELFPEKDIWETEKRLEEFLVFGTYPEVITAASQGGKVSAVRALASSTIYKDAFEYRGIKKAPAITKLTKVLALQIGSEISTGELSNLVGVDVKTVETYIDLLEKNFVLYLLPPYYTQKRKEIRKRRKVYFCDLGVRNAIINNLNPLESRSDVGALFENFIINERMKLLSYNETLVDLHFWRTYDGAEVDLVEDRGGKLFGYECVWSPKKKKRAPEGWSSYENSSYEIVNRENMTDYFYEV